MTSPLRLRRADLEDGASGPVASAHAGGAPAVDAYLAELARSLRVPAAERDQLIEELSCHIEDRMRDLLVTGLTEPQAEARTIAELGDARALARRFEAARNAPQRRRTMNVLMIAMASAAVVTGAVVLRPPPVTVRSAVYSDQPDRMHAPIPIEVGQNGGDVPWFELFDSAARAVKKPAAVYWVALRELNSNETEPSAPIGVSLSGARTFEQALDMINTQFGAGSDNRIEYREEDGRLVIATTAFFDRRETRLVTYDISELLRARLGDSAEDPAAVESAAEEVCRLIQRLVESPVWEANGGSRASVAAYGSRLFVRAPQRLLKQIEWVLDQAGGGHASQAPGRNPADDAAAPGAARIGSGRDSVRVAVDPTASVK